MMPGEYWYTAFNKEISADDQPTFFFIFVLEKKTTNQAK